jgi:Fe-S-cluster containining protein
VTFAAPADYRRLLERLDAWFDAARAARPEVPCAAGCSACCHGPFDISVADAELVADAVRRLPPDARAEVTARASALASRFLAHEPAWREPWDVRELGEDRFDALCDALADAPCPLLDEAGRCRIHPDRPLVCRLLGLGMRTPAGRVLPNACPIQARFPGYASLAPVPFGLEAFEGEEEAAMEAAAARLFGTPAAAAYETTIAGAILAFASP